MSTSKNNFHNQGIERAADLLSTLNTKNVLTTSFYVNRIKDVQEELNHFIDFLNKAKENPEFFFIYAKEHLKSHRSFLFQCIGYKGKQTKEGTVHDFQAYLAYKMNEGFQVWKEKNEIEEDLVIRVRNPNSFPSIYAVFFNRKEIAQFNPFEGFYGSRFKFKSEGEILQAGQKEEIHLREEEKREKLKLKKLVSLRTSPFTYVTSFSDLKHLIFNRKRIIERIDELIKRQEERIKHIQGMIQENRKRLPHMLKTNEEHQRLFKLIEPFFLQYNYTLEMETSKLY